MSADLKFERLTLLGDKYLPRELVLQLHAAGSLTAQAFAPRNLKHLSRTIAFVNAALANCRLSTDVGDRYALWVDHTAFDVTLSEAAEIHTTLAPLGLTSAYRVKT